MIKVTRIVKRILRWFLINTAISLIIFSFLSVSSSIPLLTLFAATFIITQTISSLCAITGFSIWYYLYDKPLVLELPITFAGTMGAAVVGIFISNQIIKSIFNYAVILLRVKYLIPSILISFVITIIVRTVYGLIFGKSDLKKSLDDMTVEIESSNPKNNHISIKEGDIYHVIKFDDLVYLSSHGKKTTLHTKNRDYVANQLIKEIENKLLSDKFVRIHKQFIINIKYLSQIKYFKGGKYFACLTDEDESTLPIGRYMVSAVKGKVGL
jgi:hypothetical protein